MNAVRRTRADDDLPSSDTRRRHGLGIVVAADVRVSVLKPAKSQGYVA